MYESSMQGLQAGHRLVYSNSRSGKANARVVHGKEKIADVENHRKRGLLSNARKVTE